MAFLKPSFLGSNHRGPVADFPKFRRPKSPFSIGNEDIGVSRTPEKNDVILGFPMRSAAHVCLFSGIRPDEKIFLAHGNLGSFQFEVIIIKTTINI